MNRKRLLDLLYYRFVYKLPKRLVARKALSMLSFFHSCNHNMFLFFINNRKEAAILAEINRLFLRLNDGLSGESIEGEYIFFSRAYSAWMGALRIGLAEQIPECYTLLRSSLETAVYGHFMLTAEDSKYLKMWMNRKDEQGKIIKDFRENFKWNSLTAGIRSDDIRNSALVLYEHTIEFGAHPNLVGMMTGVYGMGTESSMYLTVGAEEFFSQVAVMEMMWTGLTVLGVFAEVFPETYENLQLIPDIEMAYQKWMKFVPPIIERAEDGEEEDPATAKQKYLESLAELEQRIFENRGRKPHP